MKGSKGQVFVAGAALFVVLLALIAANLAPAPAMPATLAIEAQLDNIAQEYRYAIGLSAIDESDRLDDFSSYLRDNIQSFDAIYALVSVQPGTYTLRIGNFLRNPAAISITAEGSSPSEASGTVDDKETGSWDFTASGDVNITIEYTIQDIAYSQSLQFGADKNQTIGWFDIGIRSGESGLRRSGTWSVAG